LSTLVLPLILLLTRVFIGDYLVLFCVRIQCSSRCCRVSRSVLSCSRRMASSKRLISECGDLCGLRSLLRCLMIVFLEDCYLSCWSVRLLCLIVERYDSQSSCDLDLQVPCWYTWYRTCTTRRTNSGLRWGVEVDGSRTLRVDR